MVRSSAGASSRSPSRLRIPMRSSRWVPHLSRWPPHAEQALSEDLGEPVDEGDPPHVRGSVGLLAVERAGEEEVLALGVDERVGLAVLLEEPQVEPEVTR